MAKELKVGVRIGGGEPPGYKSNVFFLTVAREEALDELDECQYHHIADQFKELAYQDDPTHSETVSLDKIEDFYELRDKGGVLGNKNIRVFFAVDKNHPDGKSIVVLGTVKKENDGKTPMTDVVRMRRRKRRYEQGLYGQV